MGASGGPSIVHDGLVLGVDAADKNSYIGSGTTWTDLSPNGNNGTLTNGPTFDSGNGGTIVLDGSNDYITVNQVDSQTYTISIWFKLDALPTSGNFIVLLRQGYSPVNYALYISDAGNVYTYGVGSGGNHFTDTSIALATNNWYNIAHVKNWSSSKESVYLNGLLQYGESSFSAGSYSFNNSSQTYNYTDISRNVSNNNSFVDGKIANCVIYNKILNANQILENFNAQRHRFGV